MTDIDKLISDGSFHWSELASCRGDARFTQKHPPTNKETLHLKQICKKCDVFFECLDFHEEMAAVAVFAHGEWRYEDGDAPDRDSVPASTNEC
jgi:hypothetical protein